MSTVCTERTGFLPVPGGNVWYRVAGEGPAVPVLLLHGGPGCGHDYLEPLEALAAERPVIFYDQLGCGRSDKPADPSLWQIDRFVAEVDAVRKGLGLERIHLLGQSWGAWLALEYLLTRPDGVASVVLANGAASCRDHVAGALSWLADLPAETRALIEGGDYADPAYQMARILYYQQHVCRVDPWPDCMLRTAQNLFESESHAVLYGPSDFEATGNLKDWDRTARLGEINVPTLILGSRYDIAAPPCSLTLFHGIPGAQLHLFANSSHTPHLEETEAFLDTVRAFWNSLR